MFTRSSTHIICPRKGEATSIPHGVAYGRNCDLFRLSRTIFPPLPHGSTPKKKMLITLKDKHGKTHSRSLRKITRNTTATRKGLSPASAVASKELKSARSYRGTTICASSFFWSFCLDGSLGSAQMVSVVVGVVVVAVAVAARSCVAMWFTGIRLASRRATTTRTTRPADRRRCGEGRDT